MNDYDVGSIMQDMEIDLIRSMRRNLGAHLAWEKQEGFKWEQWQAKKLRELRKYKAHNQSIMASYSKKLDKATKADLREQFLEGGRKVDKEVSRVIQKGYSLVRGTPANDFFQDSNKKLDSLVKSINQDMAKAQNAALRQMDDVYRKIIFKTEAFLGSGAITVDKAIDMATKDFLEKGINCIKYADGKNVNIASYSRMAVRTANKRVQLMGEGERRKQWGISLVIVSQYSACSPICLPLQGRIYIDDVYSRGKQEDGPYPLLSWAIANGLFHPNCRHTMSTYFEGINEEPDFMRKSELGDDYENAQKQAVANRNIQKYTRLKEGSLDQQNTSKYNDKIKEWKNNLKAIKNSQGIAAKSARNTNTPVYYNPENDYSIKLDGYSKQVNEGLSSAIEDVAEKGSKDGFEHMHLVNLEDGTLEYYETNNEPNSVGEKGFWDYVDNNQNKKYAFVHNHNTASSFSENDIITLLTTENVPVMIAVRNDGIKYFAERKTDAIKSIWFDELYKKDLEELNVLSRNGKISGDERSQKREQLIVNNLLKDFTKGKGLVEFDGRKV